MIERRRYMGGSGKNMYDANTVKGLIDESLKSLVIPDGTTKIKHYAFAGFKGLTSVTIPNSVLTIGEYAFRNCSALLSITLPNALTSIGQYAFSGCNKITEFVIPDTVTTIGICAFDLCTYTSITIPNNVTSELRYCFRNNYYVTSITIGEKVTGLGTQCCSRCTSLNTLVLKGENIALNTTDVFGDTPIESGTGKIYVPYSADHSILNAYKSANRWSTYASQIYELDENGNIPTE